jgi:divalent metal cation (Fe/Co/Zn/Cd) transporter
VSTGWERLDPIIGLLVAANIIWTGVQLVRRSVLGLLDTALPEAELATIREVLNFICCSFFARRAKKEQQKEDKVPL